VETGLEIRSTSGGASMCGGAPDGAQGGIGRQLCAQRTMALTMTAF